MKRAHSRVQAFSGRALKWLQYGIRLLQFGLMIAAASLVGSLIYGSLGIAWSLALLGWGLLAYHRHQANKVIAWSKHFQLDHVPATSGRWEDLCARIYRRLRSHDRRTQELTTELESSRAAAQALPDGLITLDKDYRIVWSNRPAQQFLGIHLDTDLGQPLLNLVRQPEFHDYLQQKQWQKTMMLKAGRPIERSLSIQAIPYSQQDTLILVRDVTQLEKLETMRRDFIANVSHELKTPLTVLGGFLETMRDIPLDTAQRDHYLHLMQQQTIRMQRLVHDLLVLSSLEAEQHQRHDSGEHQLVELPPLMERLREEAMTLSGDQHRIHFHLDELPAQMVGQENELYSAFSNLISNAIRYTPPQGKIDVRVYLRGANQSQLCFEVSDTGIGIDPAHLPRLTERFYRVDRGRSRDTGGTGLGLAIVKHILNRHHATLDIQSTPGSGSCFTAVFPQSTLLNH